jgi:hypothetical protein
MNDVLLNGAGEWDSTTGLLITNCVKSGVPLEFQALAYAERGTR